MQLSNASQSELVAHSRLKSSRINQFKLLLQIHSTFTQKKRNVNLQLLSASNIVTTTITATSLMPYCEAGDERRLLPILWKWSRKRYFTAQRREYNEIYGDHKICTGGRRCEKSTISQDQNTGINSFQYPSTQGPIHLTHCCFWRRTSLER